jgi:cytochrome oxidase assembly protein ShyY1
LPGIPPLTDEATQVQGIYVPYPGGGLHIGGNALAAQSGWPKLTLRLDAAALGADLGQALLPGLVLQDARADSGFVREWTPQVMPPQRHWAYALQWFALALAALVIFVALHWRKVE